MNKKGNAVALILLTIAALSLGSVYIKHNYSDIKTDRLVFNELRTEVDLAMSRAITLGINDFLLNGFSDQNKVWFCNYPFPVDDYEANRSVHTFIQERAENFLDHLRAKGYNISSPVIIIPDHEEGLTENELDNIKIIIKDLILGYEDKGIIQRQDLSREYVFDWPVWRMYNGTRDWMKDNGGGFIDNIYDDVFFDVPCQAVKSCCNCSEDYLISKGLRDEMKLKIEDVYPALEKSIESLNQKFIGTEIICNYSIEKYNIENIEKFNYTETQTSYLNCTNDVLQWDTNIYDYRYAIWANDFTLPGAGIDMKTELGGCPTWDSSVDATLREHIEIDTSLFETDYESDDSQFCTLGYWLRMHNEHFALDKKLGLLLKIQCRDERISIEGEDEITYLASEQLVRISVRMDCPTPTFEPIEDKVDENGMTYACPGCFPIGTMITMHDNSKKPIEEINIGDLVLGYDISKKQQVISIVESLESPIVEGIFILRLSDGNILKITDDHPLWARKNDNKEVWSALSPMSAESKTNLRVYPLTIGDEIFKDKWVSLNSIEFQSGQIKTYNLKDVSYPHTFYADDILVHNKGGCCFPAGTEIRMGDGSYKVIEDIRIGDIVLTYNEYSGEQEASEVLSLERPVREGLWVLEFESGNKLKLTNDHPLYIDRNGQKAWAAVDKKASDSEYGLDVMQLRVDDYVLTEHSYFDRIISMHYEEGAIQTYTLKDVKKNKNFYANGYLAHNKVMGYIGPVCPVDIECPSCYGCVLDSNGNPICVPSEVDTECEGTCAVCDGMGSCTKPAPQGVSCPGECMICDGVNIGIEGCSLFDPPIARGFDCDAPCKQCAGDGSGCTKNPDYMGQIDDCPQCQTCGIEGTCIAQIGNKCGQCMQCGADGTCSDVRVGKDDCGGPCERCLPDGSCGIDLSFTNIDKDCNTCQKCGLYGCEPDPYKDGVSCSSCKVCNFGSCSQNKPDGTSCGRSGSCEKGCKGGSCTMGLNPGTSCDSGFQCASALCDDSGRCSLTTDMTGKQCCGDKICNAGDPCCPYGGWTCSACNDITT